MSVSKTISILRLTPILGVLSLLLTGATAVAPPSDADIAFFERKVRPVLIEHCYECHSADAKKLRGNLHLDSRQGWQEGGDSGPAIVPGEPGESLLVHAIRYGDDDLEMPPEQKLPPELIDVLVEWIARGVPDPRQREAVAPESRIDLEKGREFWSFQPVRHHEVPVVRENDWPLNDIDRFLLSAIELRKLNPVPDTDSDTLLRRLHLDLTGLPPTTGDIKAFRIDPDVSKVIDTLLASERFGERWGRHWLDLARYADSTGGGASKLFPDAWRYRNYVIDSFNRDRPYRRFVSQQLAGDLLPFKNTSERFDNLVATGFLVLGPRNYINDDEETFRMDGADEQLDTVGRVFLGMTLGCARCHDHKFDPVPMRDYYALAGIFTSTETYDPIPATTNFEWNDIGDPNEDPDGSRLQAYEQADARFRVTRKQLSKLKATPGADPKELARLEKETALLREQVPEKPATLMGAWEAPSPADARLRIRGNAHQPAEPVPRGFLQVAMIPGASTNPPMPPGGSGRLQLAEWITAPGHPLTLRVYVNRVWSQLMGRGLVATVDNFGTTGDEPAHPELLDWLAHWFNENGQSTKELVRLITSSRAYRLGAAPAESRLHLEDPENRLFARHVRRSLDAETLRDSILAVAGSLLDEDPGPPFPASLKNEADCSFADDYRRSVFLPRFRNNLPELFETFDVANPATVVGKRDLTILSPQALYFMNSPFVARESKRAAENLIARNLTVPETLDRMFLVTLGRDPSPEERRLIQDFLDKPYPPGEDRQEVSLTRWTAIQQNLFACLDFRFRR